MRPVPAIEPLEPRRLLSVAAATLFGTTAAGATLKYQVQFVGFNGIATRTVTVVGPTAFDGATAIERDTVDTSGVGAAFYSQTAVDYAALTDAGAVDYGTTASDPEARGGIATLTTDTYAPPIVDYPPFLTAGTPYASAWTDTRIETAGVLSNTSTVVGTRTVTLDAATPESVTVPAGTFNAYPLTVVETDGANGTPVTTRIWVAPGIGSVEITAAAADQPSYELSSVTGTATTGTAPAPLLPTIAKSTLPTEAVVGTKGTQVVRVALANYGTAAYHGTQTVAVYATTSGVTNAGGTLIGTAKVRLSLRPGRSAVVPVRVRTAALPADSYAIVARVTDRATGTVADTDAATAVTFAAPFVSLSFTVGPQAPPNVPAGRPIAFTLALVNGGNVGSSGPATIAVTLSTIDGTSTIPVPTPPRRVRVRTGGRATPLRIRIRVPPTTPADTYAINVTFTQDGSTATATGINTVIVS